VLTELIGVVVVVKEGGGSSALPSALLIGLGAVIAAIVTAIAAQLRLKATLKGERERLGDQLAHDRRMRDLEDLRSRFASAVETAEAASSTLLEAAVEMDSSASTDADAVDELLTTASHKILRLAEDVRFGWSRLGFETGVPEALEDWRLALDNQRGILRKFHVNGEFDKEKWQEAFNEETTAQGEFIDCAYRLIGARIDAVQPVAT
jgi:hypothetical protein